MPDHYLKISRDAESTKALILDAQVRFRLIRRARLTPNACIFMRGRATDTISLVNDASLL